MQKNRVFPAVVALALLPACATVSPGERDPLERVNRPIYRFNDVLDRRVARPVARAYVNVTPAPVRTGVSNFFRNLSSPSVIVNNLLQGKVTATFVATARTIVNSTIGIGGLFDPATRLGIPTSDEDFGQTLGAWGVAYGPYLVLPILGPSSARDAVGFAGNYFMDPKSYIEDSYIRYGLTATSLLDLRVRLLGSDEMLSRAFDPYVVMRSVYFQRREYQIRDGEMPAEEDFEVLKDDAADPPDEASAPPATNPN
jgi:phospholipid-binding lipoprotein MlaA